MNVGGLARRVIAAPVTVAATATGALERLIPGRRHRRTWVGRDRAHIEVRGIDRPGNKHLAAHLEKALNATRGVRWAQVNAIVGRVVVAFDSDDLSVEDLVGVIEGVEEAHDVADEPFPSDRPEHPGDIEPLRRTLIALGADVAALGGSTVGQMLHLTPVPTEVAGVVALVDNEPRLRKFLEHHFGASATDLGLGVSNALALTLAHGPLPLVVDIVHRVNMATELQARRRCWERREPALTAARPANAVDAVEKKSRPTPLPPGPIERYADRAALGSLAAAGVVLAATGSPRRAGSLLIAGLPKAARHGREAFAAQLGRTLARHDVVVMDRSALRRLDRIDTVVLDAAVVRTGRYELGEPEILDGSDPAAARKRLSSLLDPTDPAAIRRRSSWLCAPVASLPGTDVQLPRGAAAQARALGRGRRRVVVLVHNGSVVALAPLDEVVDPLAVAVVSAARDGGLGVVVAGGGPALAALLGAQRSMAGGRRLQESVRRLQHDGEGVLLVAGTTTHGALVAADCSIGLSGHGPHPPWGADLMTGPSLRDALFVVAASPIATSVSTRSAWIALAGSTLGGVLSTAGPRAGAGGRAGMPMNVAALAAQANGVALASALEHRPPPVARWETPWHAMEASEVLEALGSAPDGLSDDEARRRQPDRRVEPPPLVRLGRALGAELANPLTPVLATGAGLSAAVGSLTDAGLVASVTAANAVLGAAQRMRSDVSLRRLAEVSSATIAVRRSGRSAAAGHSGVVPGDVVALVAGDVVPADCRVLEARSCEMDESVLTGESLPVSKQIGITPGAAVADRRCMLYDGTTVSGGAVTAVVVGVGDDTEIGRTLADAPDPPPSGVEARLSALTAATLPATVAAGAAVSAMSLLRGRGPRRAVTSGVGLTVAAVPEGLPLLATMGQQAAARRLATKQALVRNPRTIEALGRVDTLCFDKTGTLTVGEIALQGVSDGRSDEPIDSLGPRSRAVLAAALRASPGVGDAGGADLPHATDRAVVAAAERVGVGCTDGLGSWEVLGELAFDPARGFHAVVGNSPNGARISAKGAPEAVLPRCRSWRTIDRSLPVDRPTRRSLDGMVERLAARGMRVLAVAERRASSRSDVAEERVAEMELLGFVTFADSVRSSAAAAVASLRTAGVRVVMATGDHPGTARAIADELGILESSAVLTGPALDAMSDDELDAVAGDVAVFARVTPRHKVRIVRALQRAGRVVAMTGDGANDAPAIRLADTGIALGSRCSPAAREAADLVVVDDRMETILDAIVEGRTLWTSVRDALAILLGGNLGEIGFTLGATALTGASPLGARQFLLVNLLTDLVPAAAVALRPPAGTTPGALLHEGPDRSLGRALASQIALRAVTTAGGAGAAWLLARVCGRRKRASTVALAALVGTQLGQTAMVGRNDPLVLAATAASTGALVAVVQTPGVSQFFGCTPLGPMGWGIAAGAAATATGASVVGPWALRQLSRGEAPSPASPLL